MMRTGSSAAGDRMVRVRSLLSQINILRGCTSAELGELGRSAEIVRYSPGELIAEQSGLPAAVCLVAFGHVRLTSFGDNGRELILTNVEPGGFFEEESLRGAAIRRAGAIALDEATVVWIRAEAFASFLHEHPRVALSFAMQLSRQLHRAYNSVAGLGLLSVEERLIRTLERLAEEQGSRRSHDGLLLHACPTHLELAARVGARRETVTRAFKSLTRRGLVVPRGDGLLLSCAGPQRD
jgi:CRP/FNR family transcriptional regulator, cyclic AMP receptor protein